MLRESFIVRGLFYEIDNMPCREYLDIKRKGCTLKKPVLMVVMMNPGSSKPQNGCNHNKRVVPTVPDNTQDQIMRVMNNTQLNYARNLNLSDIRMSKSKEFYQFLKSDEASSFNHSIFSEARKDELQKLMNKKALTIYAWGVDKALTYWATEAVNALKIEKPIGLLKSGSSCAYYHALPQVYDAKEKWVAEISHQIKGKNYG